MIQPTVKLDTEEVPNESKQEIPPIDNTETNIHQNTVELTNINVIDAPAELEVQKPIVESTESTENQNDNTAEHTVDSTPPTTQIDSSSNLYTLESVTVNNTEKSAFDSKNPNPGYIVEVPITMNKQNLQSKMKKTNIKKPDDMLQTIKQYHNVRLDDAKRTLK